MIENVLAALRKTLPSKWGFMALGAMAAASAHKELTEAARISVEQELQEAHAEQAAVVEAERDELRAQLLQLQRRVDELVGVAAVPASSLVDVDELEGAALNGQQA